eukprot:15258059-Ditylum_brightwellii.AAC.1
MAGTQTVCTTIVGAMLHLAEDARMQEHLKQGNIAGKDIVKETLRILPPVAGLPRLPTECDLELEYCTAKMSSSSERAEVIQKCPIPKNHLIVVDLVAFAHSQQQQPIKEDIKEQQSHLIQQDTLKFDPLQKCKSEAQPWGIGRRKCPAGIISVECISEVLEAMAKGGITWTFQDAKDCVGLEHCGGWMQSISYCPTLCYSLPIYLEFTVE